MERWEAEMLERLIDQQVRIAEALEKLATPPEVVTLTQDGEWAAKEKAREEREGRTVAAFERIADALEVDNASAISGARITPQSPGAIAMASLTVTLVRNAMAAQQKRQLD